jgi:DNA-binding beta-propeller fold protein YncE
MIPLIPMSPPQAVAPGWFDYVTVDASRRRVYAGHAGAKSLLIVNADSGVVIGEVKVGEAHGVAVNYGNGHVYTGNGADKTVSEIDPVAMRAVRTVPVEGEVDAIAYDPVLHRIYADEDNGTRVFVIDARTFKEIKAITLPGHKPEYLAIDPQTHAVYQNIADLAEVAVINPKTLTVARTFATPQLTKNHPLQYDTGREQIIVGGENNMLGIYERSGLLAYTVNYPSRVDQCDWSGTQVFLACAAGGINVLDYTGSGPLHIIAHADVAPSMHTLAVDPKTGTIFAVWGDEKSGYVQRFHLVGR